MEGTTVTEITDELYADLFDQAIFMSRDRTFDNERAGSPLPRRR
jgi:hypothetical protein